jgi:hypothetical protein
MIPKIPENGPEPEFRPECFRNFEPSAQARSLSEPSEQRRTQGLVVEEMSLATNAQSMVGGAKTEDTAAARLGGWRWLGVVSCVSFTAREVVCGGGGGGG